MTPPTTTGSSTANGVTLPVRPVCTSIARSSVVRSSGGNLNAIAQRGACDVAPSSRCRSVRSTLITAPSISQSTEWRCSSQCPRNARHRVDRSPPLGGRRHGQADRRGPVEEPSVRVERDTPSARAERVHPQAKRPRRGHLRVLLPQRTGGGVARVGEGLLPRLDEPLVQLARTPGPAGTSRRGSRRPRADRRTASRCGHPDDGAHVGGDVLAGTRRRRGSPRAPARPARR